MKSSIVHGSPMDYFINETTTKIVTKLVFAIHDTIEDFLITAKNQLITLGGKSLRMCRIPDESGKVGDSRCTVCHD